MARQEPRYLRYEIEPDGCWNWKGSRDSNDYGNVWHIDKVIRVHVLFWEDANGPTPAGHELHHTCKNPSCCNPEHVKPITRADHLLLEPTRLVRTDYIVEQVKHLRDQGWSFAAIGTELGIGTTTAHRAYHDLHRRGSKISPRG